MRCEDSSRIGPQAQSGLRPSYQVCVSNVRNFFGRIEPLLTHGETVAGIAEADAAQELS